jgi:hypothetical protein
MQVTSTELLTRLDYSETAPFPQAALREIISRKDEMIPRLIAVLESAHANPAEYLDGPQVMLPTYAAYLLAQFRENRAYRPLLALLNLEGDLAEQFFGDSITEDMHNIVACVFDGDEAPLRALIENPLAFEYARASSGLQTYPSLIHFGRITAAEVESYFLELFEGKLEREPNHVWNNLCSISGDLGFAALFPHVEKAFDDGLCDMFFDRFEHIEERIKSGGDPRWKRHCQPIDDIVAVMGNWACFDRKPARKPAKAAANDLARLQQQLEYPSRPTLPPPPQYPGVGRNDPCPCGSGRKFKKCCGG